MARKHLQADANTCDNTIAKSPERAKAEDSPRTQPSAHVAAESADSNEYAKVQL